MAFIREETLLPFASESLRLVPRVPFHQLSSADVLVYGGEASHFFFEFDPEGDIEQFLHHAHFAERANSGLVACGQPLCELVDVFWLNHRPPQEYRLPLPGEQPLAPLRFDVQQNAIEAIGQGGRWRGMITCCSCGIPGCNSQYAWVERGLCLFLFTISGGSLFEVECLPFRFSASSGRPDG
jgi:hypothetical protein